MFNKCRAAITTYKKYLLDGKLVTKYYKSTPLYSFHLSGEWYIHTGNSLVLRTGKFMFIARNVKYNVFFKKPLVRPTKRKKTK